MVYVLQITLIHDLQYRFIFETERAAKNCETLFWKNMGDEAIDTFNVEDKATFKRNVTNQQIISTEVLEATLPKKESDKE